MQRAASVRLQGVNNYVPKMQSSSALLRGGAEFSLGSPAVASANIFAAATAANAAAGTIVAINLTVDGTYGRNLRLTPSGDPGAAGGVIDIFGEDWLGQPMAERFSGANGATAILYGKKAFYRVNYSKIVTPSTNAVTWAIGTGNRLGLPFKSDVVWAKEGGILVPLIKRDFTLWQSMSDADVTSGASLLFSAPCPGFVKTLVGIGSGAGSTTNAAATVKIATVAVTGLTVTVDQDTQTRVTDVPTVEGYNANNRFRPNDIIEIVHAATTAGGPVSYGLEITPSQITLPVLTDPQTLTTGDPRGTYESLLTPDGSEIIVGLVGDPSYNAAGNGGLHGIRHVIA